MATTTISIRPDRYIFNGGQFDSDFRYLRETIDAPRTTMLAGPSVAVALDSGPWRISWRFKCGSFNITGESDTPNPPADVTNTPTDISL